MEVAVGDDEQGSIAGLAQLITGVSFIAGPFIGGFLYRFGYRVPFLVAFGLALLTGLLAATRPLRRSAPGTEQPIGSWS